LFEARSDQLCGGDDGNGYSAIIAKYGFSAERQSGWVFDFCPREQLMGSSAQADDCPADWR